MKKSIITAIFKGEKGNQDNIPESEILDKHIKSYWEYEDMLNKLLNDEQKAILELFNKEQSCIESEKEALAFVEGFKIGLLISFECLEEYA